MDIVIIGFGELKHVREIRNYMYRMLKGGVDDLHFENFYFGNNNQFCILCNDVLNSLKNENKERQIRILNTEPKNSVMYVIYYDEKNCKAIENAKKYEYINDNHINGKCIVSFVEKKFYLS